MESSKEKQTTENIEEDVAKMESATRYPEKAPTYIIAFTVQETYDERATTKQIICHKNITDGITNSLKPRNSSIISQTELANPVTETYMRFVTTKKNSDDKQNGEVGNNCSEVSDYFVVGNNKVSDDAQPEIIFNATTYNRRGKINHTRFSRKKQTYKKVVKLMKVHFKYKNPNNNITTRLERMYEKAKRNSVNFCQIQKGLYSSSITKVVSRLGLLKKGLAKENLSEDLYLHGNDDESQKSSQSTAQKSLTSFSSDRTLMRIESASSSKMKDSCSIHSINTVIQIPSENIIPYKTDIFNVSVAVAYKTSKLNANNDTVISSNQEEFFFKETLSSTETIPFDNFTSKTSLIDICASDNIIDILSSDTSNKSLIESDRKSILHMSSDDTFFIAKTSSDFNRASYISNDTILNSSGTVVDMHATTFIHDYGKDKVLNKKPTTTLLNTVINLGMFSEMNPSTSSADTHENDFNDVLVTGNLIKNIPLRTLKRDGDYAGEQEQFPKNILKKVLQIDKEYAPQKNMKLPNETTIKSKIEQNEQTQKKSCAEESRNNYSSSIPEIWDKLVSVVDLAVKRLEETLTDKLVTEIMKLLALFELKLLIAPRKEDSLNKEDHKAETEDVVISIPEGNVQSLQCDLVQNNVIDQLMLKLSVEKSKVSTPKRSTDCIHNLKEKYISKDYIEAIKPPVVEGPFEDTVVKGDTVTVSTISANVANEEFIRFSRLKLLLSAPMHFFRENMLVITSVPTFFVALLCIYGIILMFMSPW